MIFKSLHIQNFRGIKEAEITDFSRVNLFVGKNNSGKTSLLEALFLLSGPRNPNCIVFIDNNRLLNHDEEDDFRFAFYKLDYNNTILLKTNSFVNDELRELIITPLKGGSRKSTVTNTGSFTSGNNLPPQVTGITIDSSYNNMIDGLEFDYSTKKSHSQKKQYRNSIKLVRNSGLVAFQTDNLNNTREGKSEDFMGLLQSSSLLNVADLSNRLNKLIIEKKKEDLLEPLKTIDSRIVNFELGVKNIINFDIGAERLIPSNLMGDGVLKLMLIISNMYHAKDGVLLIDEVDNGLHTSTLKMLWKTLFFSAKKYNCQLFITTHSAEVITNLEELLNEPESKEFQEDIRCFTIIKSDKDKIVSLKYDFAKLDFAIDRKIDIRDIN
jgi:AAA15 family ATPase/GTPase